MLEADAKLYLPISADTLLSVCQAKPLNAQPASSLVSDLATHEIASLFFLMHLQELNPNNDGAVEQLLAQCISACQHQRASASEEVFQDSCNQQLDVGKIRTGYFLLPDYQTIPMDEHTLEGCAFLDDAGLWSYEFCQQHRQMLSKDLQEVKVQSRTLRLSGEQSRIYRELMAGQDEHIHIQGYAGTGKTTLIKSLLSLLEAASTKVMVLAERKAQLDVFHSAATQFDRVQMLTYTDLAKLIISENSTELGEETLLKKGYSRSTMPDGEIIRHLGLRDSGSIKAMQLVKAVRATLFRYCQSDDDEIDVTHIPRSYQGVLDAATQGAVSQYASRFWRSILLPPTKDFTPQVRAYHIIKWAALNRCVIPNEFTHVLIDECHDLPAPINQILSNSPQARISLGDDYQNLSGGKTNSSMLIRQREMHHSLRSSHQVEGLLNPIILAHPSQVNATFYGNRMNRLALEYYEKASVPSEPTLVLVNDLWGLFEWTQRMASGQLTINLLSNAIDLDTFVQDCIELYSNGTRARHGELFRYASWQQLSQHYRDNPAFIRVNRMLERKYSQQDWQNTRSFIADNAKPGYSLALVENVRNLEFDNVMITPQLVSIKQTSTQESKVRNVHRVANIRPRNNKKRNAQEASYYAAVYVAVTRARKRLIVPEQLRHHIEEISGL